MRRSHRLKGEVVKHSLQHAELEHVDLHHVDRILLVHLGRTHSQAKLPARKRFLALIADNASEVISDTDLRQRVTCQ